MSDQRRNEYVGTYLNQPQGNEASSLNYVKFDNDNNGISFKNEFLTSKKRNREDDESSYRENSNKVVQRRESGYSSISNQSNLSNASVNSSQNLNRENQRKKDLVKKIIDNLNSIEENIKENTFLRTCAENLKSFSIEDYGKFFQVMANVQYVCSQDSEALIGKNKDLISINEKLIKFNSDLLEDDFNTFDNIKDINKLITRKEVSLKSFLKEKLNIIHEEISQTSLNNSMQVKDDQTIPLFSFKSFFEDLLKTVKKENIIENIQIKNLIKIYSNFIYNNGIISFTNVDKLLLDFIIENSLTQNNIKDFYSLCKFWLYEDYLNFEKMVDKYEFLEEKTGMSNFNQFKRRLDSILDEILPRIENHEDLFEIDTWVTFMEDLPRINERVVENIITTHEKIMSINFEKIKKESTEKKALIDQLTHLRLMKNFYVKMKRPSVSSEKLLIKFLELTKSSDSHVIAMSIKFLKDHILTLGKYEMDKIKEFAAAQFKELVKINETTLNYEGAIVSKYPLYFSLFQSDEDLLMQLPIVYSDCHEIVKNALNKNLGIIIRSIDTFRAEKLIQKCSEKCLNIVLFIIEGKLFKPENMFNKSLNENKLFRRIKNYYNDTNYLEILVALSDKVQLKDFFKTHDNFVWEKIKQLENKKQEESLHKIFNHMNNTKNENLFIEEFNRYEFEEFNMGKLIFKSFNDKLALYILFFILNMNETLIDENNLYNINKTLLSNGDLMILIKYYKNINSTKFERISENILEILNRLINYKKINGMVFIKVIEIITENFAQLTNAESKSVKSDSQTVLIQNENIINTFLEIILDKLREYLNNSINLKEPSDAFINEFIIFIKKLSQSNKEIILNNLDERVKDAIRTKDFILFSNI